VKQFVVKVTTKEKGLLASPIEHIMRGPAWEVYEDEPWTIVQVGTPTKIEPVEDGEPDEGYDHNTVDETTMRVQVPTETVQSITVAVEGEQVTTQKTQPGGDGDYH
jgi:hypothetical protein